MEVKTGERKKGQCQNKKRQTEQYFFSAAPFIFTQH
jgi:hypothetical protein